MSQLAAILGHSPQPILAPKPVHPGELTSLWAKDEGREFVDPKIAAIP